MRLNFFIFNHSIKRKLNKKFLLRLFSFSQKILMNVIKQTDSCGWCVLMSCFMSDGQIKYELKKHSLIKSIRRFFMCPVRFFDLTSFSEIVNLHELCADCQSNYQHTKNGEETKYHFFFSIQMECQVLYHCYSKYFSIQFDYM